MNTFLLTRGLVVSALLLCSLLGSHSVISTAVQQDPNTVSIQPTTGNSGRGAPNVIVTVDKPRVRIGEMVRFTLTPASVVSNPIYKVTIDFGDGIRRQLNRAEATYRYRAKGHYTVYASVTRAQNTVGPPDDPAYQRIPRVTLSAAPTPARAGQVVNFTAQIDSQYPNLKYRFFFGDGGQTNWQDSPSTSHAFQSPGTYLAYVDIGTATGTSVRRLGGSQRKSVGVISVSVGPVDLLVSPAPVGAGQPARLTARLRSMSPNLVYRFTFGDGTQGGWQVDPQTLHVYASAGSYSAYVDVASFSSSGIEQLANGRNSVQVVKIPPPPINRPSPQASPSPVIIAKASPSPAPRISPSPSPGGSIATAVTSPSTIASPASSPVEPGEPGDFERNWLIYLLIALLLLFAGYKIWQWIVGPHTRVSAFADAGEGEVKAGAKGLAIESEVVLRPNISEGNYLIHTNEPSLVKKVRREDV